MTDAERESLYRVAYDEAVRALAGQQVLIESLRARAGLLLSAAAVTTSFLGSQALSNHGVTPVAWIALLAFAAAAGACLAVLWPRRWEFVIGSHELIHTYAETEQPPPLATVYQDLALHVGESIARNENGLERLGAVLQIAGILLSLDVALWTVAVAVGA